MLFYKAFSKLFLVFSRGIKNKGAVLRTSKKMINTRGRIRKDQAPFDYSSIENPEYRDLREERSHASSMNEGHTSDVTTFQVSG